MAGQIEVSEWGHYAWRRLTSVLKRRLASQGQTFVVEDKYLSTSGDMSYLLNSNGLLEVYTHLPITDDKHKPLYLNRYVL